MTLIGRRKKKQHLPGQVLGYVKLVLKALVAQRVARKAYHGYKWTRRLPFLVGGGAIVAFVARKLARRSGQGADTGFTTSHPSTTTTAASSPAVTPTTPTPTGSPTAVTPAPTAAADGAPEPEPQTADVTSSGEDTETKS